jgi:ATPase subunit of ABC transporter with duplicated ATPase domains
MRSKPLALGSDSKLEHARGRAAPAAARCGRDEAVRGERRRVALCRLLLQPPDSVALDELTNHLTRNRSPGSNISPQYSGSVVAITHAIGIFDNVAGWILELDRTRAFPREGNYSGWLQQKQQRLALEEKQESKRQRTLQRELEWIRMSARARQAKGKARLNHYEQLLNEDTAEKQDRVEIYIPPGPRLGDVVVEARGLRKGYGDPLLIDNLEFTYPRAASSA